MNLWMDEPQINEKSTIRCKLIPRCVDRNNVLINLDLQMDLSF